MFYKRTSVGFSQDLFTRDFSIGVACDLFTRESSYVSYLHRWCPELWSSPMLRLKVESPSGTVLTELATSKTVMIYYSTVGALNMPTPIVDTFNTIKVPFN